MSLTVIDLFAGCGGLSLGLKRAGLSIVGAVEIDQWAADTYRKNFPTHELIQTDIRDINAHDLRKAFGRGVDIVVGGPPCQGFSVSGKRQYGEVSDKNSLVATFLDAVEGLAPPIVLMENVLGFRTGKLTRSQKVMDFTESRLAEMGYLVTHAVLEAPFYGVPSLRSRVFILATKFRLKCNPFPPVTHFAQHKKGQKPYVTCWDGLSDLPPLESGQVWQPKDGYGSPPQNAYQRKMRIGSKAVHNHVAMKHTQRVIDRFALLNPGESAYQLGKRNGDDSITVYKSNNQRLHKDQIALCITANFQSTFVHPVQPRNLTAREAARLMSFPDNFVFEGKRTQMSSKFLKKYGRENEDHLSQYNQIGNAVPPLLAEAIGKQIIESIDLSRSTHLTGVFGESMKLPF